MTINVGPGTHRPTNGTPIAVIDSRNVALIGAGRGKTVFECGSFGDEDAPCSYMNFQIRSSSSVFVSGVTFSHCGPITSAVYISTSENIVIRDCEFRSAFILLTVEIAIQFVNTS